MSSATVVYARALNFILGAGVLGVPYCFATAGIAAASAMLIAASLLSFITVSWLLETCDRADAFINEYGNSASSSLSQPLISEPPAPSRRASFSSRLRSWATSTPQVLHDVPKWTAPADTPTLEMAQMTTLFLGDWARQIWVFSISVAALEAMWVCCAVWVASAKVAFAPFLTDELMLLAVFSCIALPLCVAPSEAVARVHVAFGVASLLTMGLMILTVGYAVLSAAAPLPSSPTAASELLLFSPSGFGAAAATMIFSQMVQPSIPSLRRDAAASPAATRRVIGVSLLTTCLLYLALGILSAYFFREATSKVRAAGGARSEARALGFLGLCASCAVALQTAPHPRARHPTQVISLNWIDYTAGAEAGRVPLWALGLSRWILLLPLFSTSAAFPLYCAVLVGNLAETLGPASTPMSARGRALLSVACALPAVVLTWCVHDTALIFSLAGLSAFFIVFFFPAFLQERCRDSSAHPSSHLFSACVRLPQSRPFLNFTPGNE